MGIHVFYLIFRFVEIIVVVVFMLWLSVSIAIIPNVDIGLEQDLAMPLDSFVRKYLQSVGNELQIGPPVYWVVKKGLDYSKPEHQNLICGGPNCNSDSMFVQLYTSSHYPEM